MSAGGVLLDPDMTAADSGGVGRRTTPGQHVLSPRGPDGEEVGGRVVEATSLAATTPARRPAAALPCGGGQRRRQRRGGGRRRRRAWQRGRVSRETLLAAGHPLAPDNTTDFLMDDHPDPDAEPLFDRYGWPTPRHGDQLPAQPDWPPGAEPPSELATLVAQHMDMERCVERVEERLQKLRERRHSSAEDASDEEMSQGEVRMRPETAAKIRVLQAEISRLERENGALRTGNETLAARVLTSDTSDSEQDSSTSSSGSSSSTSSSEGSSSGQDEDSSSSSSSERSTPRRRESTAQRVVTAPCSPTADKSLSCDVRRAASV